MLGIVIWFSVWENIAALENFAYNGRHIEVMRNRRQWFEKPIEPMVVLWWINENQLPSVYEAKERLEYLRQNGSTDYAFDFKYTKIQNDK